MREAIRKWLGIDADVRILAGTTRCVEDQQAANALQIFERLNKQDDAISSIGDAFKKEHQDAFNALHERTREQYADIVDLQTRLLALERKAEDRTPRAQSINKLRAMISAAGGIKDNLGEVAS